MTNRLTITTFAYLAVAALARVAFAQADGISATGGLKQPQGDIGIRVGDNAVLHAGVTTEVGYDTNVFYDNSSRIESAVLRVTSTLELTNASRDPSIRSTALTYSLAGALAYREYLTDNQDVKAQRAVNPSVSAALAYTPGQSLSFSVSDSFSRTEEAPYGPSTGAIIRDYNTANAQVRVAPGGGRIAAALRYTNNYDFYENQSLKYASNMTHDLLLDLSWKWLPKTALYLQGGIAWTGYLEPMNATSARFDSYSYRVIGGIRGLITPKLSMGIGAGYADAVYDGKAASPSGSGSVSVGVDVSYRPAPFTALGVSYAHGFRNSPIVGTFYEVDTVGVSISQMVASRLALGLGGRYEYRRYAGLSVAGAVVSRKDSILIGGAQADYFIKRWLYAGIVYAITFNDSTEEPDTSTVVGVDYTKHQVLGRVGVIY